MSSVHRMQFRAVLSPSLMQRALVILHQRQRQHWCFSQVLESYQKPPEKFKCRTTLIQPDCRVSLFTPSWGLSEWTCSHPTEISLLLLFYCRSTRSFRTPGPHWQLDLKVTQDINLFQKAAVIFPHLFMAFGISGCRDISVFEKIQAKRKQVSCPFFAS